MLRILGYQFRPRLVPSLMAVAGCGLFLALTLWQLQRAADKRVLQDDIERSSGLPALEWPAQADGLREHRRIHARGSLLLTEEILLDNRVHQGKAGYHVITPLRVTGHDTLLLVNRGWVPLGEDRARPPATPGPAGLVEVRGRLQQPAGKPLGLSAQAAAEASTERVWPYLDRQRLEQRLQAPVADLLVLLDADLKFGFTRDWPRIDTKVGMHLAYALQWLAFALIAFFTYLYVSIRRVGTSS